MLGIQARNVNAAFRTPLKWLQPATSWHSYRHFPGITPYDGGREIMGRSSVARYINAFFEERVEQLFDLANLVEQIFSAAGLDYRVIGGLAAYLYIEESQPEAGRLTQDVDIAVRRADLDRIAQAAERFGLAYRHVAGIEMLVQAEKLSARRAVHLIFAGEKVRPEYPEPTPNLGRCEELRGLRLIPLGDLVRTTLTSFQ